MLIAAILLLSLPQSPEPQAVPSTSWVEGRVVDRATRMPLRDALVVLQRTDQSYRVGEDLWQTQTTPGDAEPAAARRSIMTGEDGRFRFQVTVPARFTLYTEKLGYVRDSDGIRGERKSGGAADPVEITLIQESRLEGRVVDRESGAPVRGVRVIAHGQWDKAGKGFLIPHGSAVTNEKGEFTIEKLRPDEYWVECRPAIESRVLPAGPEKDFRQAARFGYGPTWYPNAPSREESSPVRLISASTTDRIELRVERRRFAAIRGKVTLDESAARTDEVDVLLIRLHHGWDSRSYAGEARGKVRLGSGYEIAQLSAGRYWLSAWIPGKTPADRQAADLVFEVTDENLDGMDLHLMKGLTVHGRLRRAPMEGPPPEEERPESWEDLQAGLSPIHRSHTEADKPAPVERETGRFVVEGVMPGEYSVFARLPRGYLQAESFYNGTRTTHHEIRVERSSLKHEVEIFLRPPGGSLSVTVTDGTNPVAGALVLAMPEPVGPEAARALRIRAKTDEKGVASIAHMLAGTYRVIAFAGGKDWSFDGRLLERFRAAPSIKISGGGQHLLQIRPESQ